MKEILFEEELMFRNIIEVLTQRKIDKVKSVTIIYDENSKESILIDFLVDGVVETFGVYPKKN